MEQLLKFKNLLRIFQIKGKIKNIRIIKNWIKKTALQKSDVKTVNWLTKLKIRGNTVKTTEKYFLKAKQTIQNVWTFCKKNAKIVK
jgi:hypothetical protein